MNKRKWISVIAAFWSAVAIALSGELVEANGLLRTLNSELNGIRLDKLIVLAALVAFYYKVWDRFVEESKWITHLLAAFVVHADRYQLFHAGKLGIFYG